MLKGDFVEKENLIVIFQVSQKNDVANKAFVIADNHAYYLSIDLITNLISKLYQTRRFIYLVDDVQPCYSIYRRVKETFLTTSPDEDKWDNFQKQKHAEMLYMPVWSREEVESEFKLQTSTILENEKSTLHQILVDQYDYYGGIARNVFANSVHLEGAKNRIENAISELSVRNMLRFNKSYDKKDNKFDFHKIFAIKVDNESYRASGLEPVSENIRTLINNKICNETLARQIDLVFESSIFLQFYWENLVHTFFGQVCQSTDLKGRYLIESIQNHSKLIFISCQFCL